MRSEQDIEEERMMNARYDKDYSGVYVIQIVLAVILLLMSIPSEILFFTNSSKVQAVVVSETKIYGRKERSEYTVAFEVESIPYHSKVTAPMNKYQVNDYINIRYLKQDPTKIAMGHHFLNAMLAIIGCAFIYFCVKKYNYNKKMKMAA